MNIIQEKPYTGVKQVLFESGHLWYVEQFIRDIREAAHNGMCMNMFSLYENFYAHVSRWNLRIHPKDLGRFFTDEIRKP